MTTRYDFAVDLLTHEGWPTSQPNLDAIVAWGVAEDSHAKNNMLDTTESWPNATDYNSTGVKNYETWEDGIAATAATLHNGRYANVIEALERGNSAISVANAVGASPWGTGNFSPEVEAVEADRDKFYNQPISAGNPPPVGKPPTPTTPPTEGTFSVNLPTLSEGSSGNEVKTIQSILNGKAGKSLSVDGEFGPETNAAVREWQEFFKLTVDGVVGPQTWGTLLVL